MQLSDSDISTIVNALRSAAIRYRETEVELREAGHKRVSEQFGRQALDATLWADRFEQADRITLEP